MTWFGACISISSFFKANMTWLRAGEPISSYFFIANMTGFQGRDPISVNFLISEYECLTRGRVTAGPLECYKSTLPLWFWSISWFSRIFKDPPLSKIRKIQAMDEITIVNNIFVENRKFTESQEEIKRRKAAVDCFDCCERMLRMPQLVKYASVGTNRGIFFSNRDMFTATETCLPDFAPTETC